MAGSGGASAVTATSPCIRNLETFQEIIQGNGYSALKSMANGEYLTSNGTSAYTANSTTVGTDQEFKILDLGNAAYQLDCAVNGQTNAVQSNGTLVPDTAGPDNTFSIYNVGATIPGVITGLSGNTYRVMNENSSFAIDVSGASLVNGAVVDQWPYSASNNQKWIFTNTANGFYTLKNVNSGLMLDVSGASTSEGALIDQWQSTGSLNQLWVPQYVNYADGGGLYNLYSANAPADLNLLEVPGASTAEGTQLDQWEPNGGLGQMWNIQTP